MRAKVAGRRAARRERFYTRTATFARVTVGPRDFPLDLLPIAQTLRRRTTPEGVDQLWCLLRRRYVVTQPEELVRQAAIVHLATIGYPINLMQAERAVPGSRNRSDLIVLDPTGAPFLLLEAKRPDVSHLRGVAQLADYRRTVGAPYAVAINGVRAIGVAFDEAKASLSYLEVLPDYPPR